MRRQPFFALFQKTALSFDRLRRQLVAGLVWALMCMPQSSLAVEEPLNVVATTGMVADTVRVIGGDTVKVKQLMGEGVDPHLYRITQNDIRALAGADAVFWNGLHLEAQMEDFLARLKERRPVFAIGESVPLVKLTPDGEPDAGRKLSDPHIWMDPLLWRYVSDAVVTALIALKPEHEAAFRKRGQVFDQELVKLRQFGEALIATVPENARILVTAHDAFGYFGKAFDLEVAAVQGLSTESEAGLEAIEGLVELLVTHKISGVFAETSVSDRSMLALIEGAAAQNWTVSLGDPLFSDAMGKTGTPEGTYIGMIEHNIQAITKGLGGIVPTGGFTAWKESVN